MPAWEELGTGGKVLVIALIAFAVVGSILYWAGIYASKIEGVAIIVFPMGLLVIAILALPKRRVPQRPVIGVAS